MVSPALRLPFPSSRSSPPFSAHPRAARRNSPSIRPRFARPPAGFAPPCADLTDSAMTVAKARGAAEARGAAKTRAAAKADAKLAVKSKGAKKPVRGSRGKAGKDPVKGSKGKAPKTIKDIEEAFTHAHDPNMPKRPHSAFYIFLEDFRRQLKEQNSGNMSVVAEGKAVGDRWKALGKKGQATYAAIAKQQMREYKKAMAAYKGESPPASEEEEEDKEESEDEDDDE